MKYFFAIVATIVCFLSSSSAERPNVVVILTDDQGWGDLSINGNADLETPNIDSLARDGASLDRFYVCPVCSPTRAEFLTGRYHPRCGVYSTSAGGERLNLDESTIADTFKAAGYATAAFGKWHNGMQYPYHPNGRGFDYFYGFCSGHWGDYFGPPLDENGKRVTGEGFMIDDFTNRAMDFIEQNKKQPFFAYLAYNTPHSPMQVPDRWWNRFRDREFKMFHREPKKENVGHKRAALAMCENIDWNVGRLLSKLTELGIADNTIVVYFCDNGPNGARWNGEMKGRKGSTDEGGVRSPLLIRWPNNVKPQSVPMYAGVIDLRPTLADLAGIPVLNNKPLDGVSFKPLLFGSPAENPNRLLFSSWRNRVSVRSGPFRLDHQGKLFNLYADPGQYRDVSAENADTTQRLKNAVSKWRTDVLSELKTDERPFVIGHADAKTTEMPARDANGSGGIKRSNRFPNCSYFTNWTKTSDSITWDAEVLDDGRFEVDLYYACPVGDEGASIELRFNDSRLLGTVKNAHEVPDRGGENDRVQRMESYVKDFTRLQLGVIDLKKGKGTLELAATKNEVGQVMEFRTLMFTRIQ